VNNNAFVIMPYGVRKDIDGQDVDFDHIYEHVIHEAVRTAGLTCIRCDDLHAPGWVPKRMLEHIFEDRVAVVDTSTLNANVFYELGVRHALKKAVTVLMRREGTSSPFNIQGLSAVSYGTTPQSEAAAIAAIRDAITSGLNNPKNIDSLVYQALPDLNLPARQPKPLISVQTFAFALVKNPEKRLALITGDREDIKVGEIWVNSENTNMQMDGYYGRSTSAMIRYLGAALDPAGQVVEDTIGKELAAQLGSAIAVAPATVFVTGPGALGRTNGVKRIFHVASVQGEPRVGYRPITKLERCVKNAFNKAAEPPYQAEALSSILFPIFGTGPGRGNFEEHAERCFSAAIEAMESEPAHPIKVAYFYVWSDADLEICLSLARNHSGLQAA
jgi:O-acetyl-ADP-ribose deacetylase (regulator of RNase III)